MAYSEFSEFPHSVFGRDNNAELLHLFRELTNKYSTLVNEIKTLSDRLDKWERTGNETISTNIREVTNNLNNTISTSTDTLRSRYDDSIRTLERKTDEKLSEISDTMSTTVGQIIDTTSKAIEKRLDSEMKKIDTELSKMYTTINNKMNDSEIELLGIVDNEYEKLQQSLIDDINIINNRIDVIYTLLDTESAYESFITIITQYAYTCYEWYFSTVTCSEWNDSNINCVQWLGSSKYMFGYYTDTMLSPLTGLHQPVKEVLNALFGYLNINAITAGEYDNMRLTAEEYDKQLLTAMKYDWRGLNGKH